MDAPARAATVVLVRGGREVARWSLRRPSPPDLGIADELARLQLAARRAGCSIRLVDVAGDLAALLGLVGLDGVLAD